jgi:catechol 2,3-dioxygenase-like lactoylglutathione lyase family enzyme
LAAAADAAAIGPSRAGAESGRLTPFRLQRLDHVSLNVSDRSRSIAWYRDVLGLELRNQPKADDWPAFMGEFGRCVGLFQAQDGEAAERGTEAVGFRHLAFMVGKDDLERAQAHFAESGVEFRFEDHGNAHSVYLRDPDGHTIELTTYDV